MLAEVLSCVEVGLKAFAEEECWSCAADAGFEPVEDSVEEWHAGVLSAERPAERAMCSNGRGGREKSVWCVLRNRLLK